MPTPYIIKDSIDVVYPETKRSLPSPSQIKRILSLPLVQLFVAGRSGSVLLHSLLDSHSEVLDIPHIFKFYDFAVDFGDMTGVSPYKIALGFVQYDQHVRFFDSAYSMHIGNRLGPDMRHHIVVDTDSFCRVFSHCLAVCGAAVNTKTVFYCLTIAYNWCLDRDLDNCRVIFQHLHHGDWLVPELLLDSAQISGRCGFNPFSILKADRLVVTVRNPFQAFSSVCRYARLASSDRQEEIERCELYLRLLLQDWVRLGYLMSQTSFDLEVIRFEDMHSSLNSVLDSFCSCLGVNPESDTLSRSTFYNLDWHGDIFTQPKTTVGRGAQDERHEFLQDNAIIAHVLGKFPERFGYSISSPLGIDDTIASPCPRLFVSNTDEFLQSARLLASGRIEFAGKLKKLVEDKIENLF